MVSKAIVDIFSNFRILRNNFFGIVFQTVASLDFTSKNRNGEIVIKCHKVAYF